MRFPETEECDHEQQVYQAQCNNNTESSTQLMIRDPVPFENEGKVIASSRSSKHSYDDRRSRHFLGDDSLCDPTAPKSKRLKVTKKSVSFSDTAFIFNYHYLSSAEGVDYIESTWYDERDYEKFMADSTNAVTTATKCEEGGGNCLALKNCCIRGLEIFVFPCLKETKTKTVKLNLQSILGQQKVQRQKGVLNPKTLSRISNVISQKACKYAFEVAATDADEVAAGS